MSIARFSASRSGSFADNTSRLGLRVLGWCGIAVALCLIELAPAAVQAQTAYFSGTVRTLASDFNEPIPAAPGPTSVAVDGSGDVFVANPGNSTVYEIVAVNGSIPVNNPTINTVGSGFAQPYGVAVDGSGNVYVTDYGNRLVKEIVAVNGSVSASSQMIVLAAATTFPAPTGIAVGANGNVYVTNFVNNTAGVTSAVEEIVAVGGSVSATSSVIPLGTSYQIAAGAGFAYPEGIAVDAKGNVFVADYDNEQVEEIVAVNGSVSAGSTVNVLGSGFYKPDSVAVDASGNVFVADSLNNEVKEIVAANGSIPSSNPTINILGSGFVQPNGVAVGGNGNVFVADTNNDAVKQIETAGVSFGPVAVATATGLTDTLTFTFDAFATLGAPAVLTQGAPNLDFINAGTGTCTANTAYSVGESCTVSVTFTPKSPGPRYGAVQLLSSTGTVAATGYVYGTGTGPQINFLPGTQSALIPPTTSTLACVTAPAGSPPGPTGTAVDASGNVYVANPCTNTVSEIMAVNGSIPASPALITLGSGFNQPYSVAVDGGGNVFVADYGNNLVKEIVAVNGSIPASPQIITLAMATIFPGPTGIAVDASGNVYVANFVNDIGGVTNGVEEIVAVGGSVSATSSVIPLGSGFYYPEGVAVDASGDVFVADYDNEQVKEIMAVNGSIPASSPTINILGSGFNKPASVAVDGNGDVFVADSLNNAVKEIVAVNGSIPSTNPTINVLGSGLMQPVGVAVGGNGNVFVADAGGVGNIAYSGGDNTGIGSALEELDYADVPTLTFATSTNDGAIDTTDGTDGALSVQIENNGNEPLTGIAPGLSVSADFTQVDGSGTPADCTASFSLTAGAACNISVNFAPIAPVNGTVDGSAVLTDNNLNASPDATQTIPLVGTAAVQQASLTSVTAVPSMVDPVQAVTLTAMVSAAVTGTVFVPTGTVTFYNNGTQLGAAVPLVNGTAALVVPSLPAGATATITATYSGDSNFLGSTSNSTSVVVTPYYFTFTNSGVSEYTAAPGAVATYNFALTPLFGSYAGPVSFTVTGLPAGAAASFTPSSVAVGGGATPITMTVQLAAAVARNHNSNPFGRGIVLALLLSPFGMKRSIRKWLNCRMLLLLLLLAGTTSAVSGCGSNGSSTLQSSQVYTLTVTATSGTLVRNQAVTLLVQQ